MSKQFTCPKCGSEQVELRYFRFRDTKQEQLSCHCERCRYRWNQSVVEGEENDDGSADTRRAR